MPWTIAFDTAKGLEWILIVWEYSTAYIGEDVKLASLSSSTSPGPSKLWLLCKNREYLACNAFLATTHPGSDVWAKKSSKFKQFLARIGIACSKGLVKTLFSRIRHGMNRLRKWHLHVVKKSVLFPWLFACPSLVVLLAWQIPVVPLVWLW